MNWWVVAWEIWGNLITGHMCVTICTSQWKWRLWKNLKMLLNCFACYDHSNWPNNVFIISLYIHVIRSPIMVFSHISHSAKSVMGSYWDFDLNQIDNVTSYFTWVHMRRKQASIYHTDHFYCFRRIFVRTGGWSVKCFEKNPLRFIENTTSNCIVWLATGYMDHGWDGGIGGYFLFIGVYRIIVFPAFK
jgi:hypothetical protein